MLQAISWGEFLRGTAMLLVAYYAVVAAAFYTKEIQQYFLNRRQAASDKAAAEEDAATDGTASFESLELIVHEIDSILEEAGNQATKDQLLPELKAKLASYDGLRRPAFRVAVFNHITSQAEIICGVRISAQELEG